MSTQIKPHITLDPQLQEDRKTQTAEEGQVIVHCSIQSDAWGSGIRVWNSTYLIDRVSGERSELIHFFNITLYPQWLWLEPNQNHTFTLIFSALPKGCNTFDLIEVIPQDGGFEVKNITRNREDVYRVKIF